MMHTLSCSYNSINGAAPTQDQVEHMERLLTKQAIDKNLIAISDIRYYWDLAYKINSDESHYLFWLFRDYKENE